ncbi:mechanosensitive ion channel family protein [Teredinibacter haidensis]|uniref:mechanosensitive ion channel family protein n=1 Tax=Teredinibacter haidensis TaxID=2731755 RepID=UPI000948A623|nr:mechanosensitive ion channel domain-containing protein [Teredinibacter haidensis]
MTQDINLWYTSLSESLTTLLNQFATFIPQLLAAVVILLIGYVVAKILRFAVATLLTKIGLDKLATHTGIEHQLQRLGNKLSISGAIGVLTFWMVWLLFIITAAESLGLPQLSQTMDHFVSFIPKIIAATLILLFGIAAANLARNFVYNGAKAARFEFAKPVSSAVYGLTLILVISLAISELEIETRLLDYIVSILLASLGIAAAISLGLGSRNASENILYSVYLTDSLHPGDSITLKDGRTGKVMQLGPVVTTLETPQGGRILVNNKDLIEGFTIHP